MKSHVRILIYNISIILLIGGCSSENDALDEALQSITPQDLASDTQILASDEFEGRGPATRGEEKTIQFLKEEFEKLGLQPGNGDSYFQEVPLIEITTDPETRFAVRGKTGVKQFRYAEDFVALTKHMQESVQVQNSELVFVGYGIVAPEYGWNDYADIDVTGKTVVILVNDPGFATQDASLFNGKAMTYYGRFAYKYEEAARQGAIGAFVVHETDAAGYPWGVVRNSFTGPQFSLSDSSMTPVMVEGWMTVEMARAIFQHAGFAYDILKTSAADRGFKAKSLTLQASLNLENAIRNSTSNNVIAILPGRERSDEYLVYMAHWEHLGIDSTLTDDSIYNGALDNAIGTAALLELAEAFSILSKKPERSILFLAVTAHEIGLYGSAYYTQHPVYPLNQTVAALIIGSVNTWGTMRDITIVGYGNSELDDYVVDVARSQGRTVRPDPESEKGYFYRNDHFNFAKQGVPVLYPNAGIDHREHGAEWGLKQIEDYITNRYHKTSDEYDPNWDLSGMVEDLKLLFKVGYRLTNESTFPKWREGVEFKAKRDADMARKTLNRPE